MLQVGENIRVRLVEGSQISGLIASVSPVMLCIMSDSSPQGYYRIPLTSVAYVFSLDVPRAMTREDRSKYPLELS